MKTRKWKISIANCYANSSEKTGEAVNMSFSTRSRMREIARAIKTINSAGLTVKRASGAIVISVVTR